MKRIFVAGLFVFSIMSFTSFEADAAKAVKKDAQAKTKTTVKVTFIELGSVNCVPCKAMVPVMKAIEEDYGDQVKIVFYDVWTAEGKPYGEQYGIRAIPTQIFLDKDGKEFFRHMGFFPKEEIVKLLEKQGVKKSAKSAVKKKENSKPR